MKLPSLPCLGKHVTTERLAVVVFLAVAFGLCWGMQARPEWVITFQTGMGDTVGEFSPDGTIYFVREINTSRRGGMTTFHDGEFRMRAFDLTAGREIWHWERGKTDVAKVHDFGFERISSLARSPDGRLLAECADVENFHDRVRVRDIPTGKLLATLDGFRNEVPNRWFNDKPCSTGVIGMRFEGSQLCVITANIEDMLHRGISSFSPHEHVQLHMFDTSTFQRLHTTEPAVSPCISADGRFLSFVRDRFGPCGYGVVIYDLREKREFFFPREINENCRIGFMETSTEGTLHYALKMSTLFVRDDSPGWMVSLRKWLGLANENEHSVRYDLTFRHLADGRTLDRWRFHAKHLTATPIPGRDQMLLHICPENDLDRLEHYALPPRRPWFHILGWALLAGVSVELLGLWRRWRGKRVVADSPEAVPVGLNKGNNA